METERFDDTDPTVDLTIDPGWRRVRADPLALATGGLPVRLGRRASDGLIQLRSLFLTFSTALVLIGGVVAILATTSSSEPSSGIPDAAVAAAIAVVGLVQHVLGFTVVPKPLDCTDETRLAASYRARFFLRVAFSESAALLGFVGFVLTARWWTYAVGFVFAAIGFARLAPTAGHLQDDQRALWDRGCERSLTAALRRPAGSPIA